jgi:hypothetical protein
LPAGVPVLFVPKPEGKLKLVVDYCLFNTVTIKDCYILPLLAEIYNCFQRAVIFTKVDLRRVYNLVRIKAGKK